MGSRAQSEVIGVVLLTFVIVVTVGVSGTIVLGGVADDADTADAPLVDAVVEVTANEITVTHGGGDPVAQSSVTVILRGDTTTERYSLDDANLSGDDDGSFEVTERFRRDHDLVGPTVEVMVVHDTSGTVLAQQVSDVGEFGDQLPIARFDISPAHPDPGESVTLDASASADNDGTIGEYRWDLGDGTTATGETVSHTYDTEGNYTVSLTVEDDDGATDTTNTTYWITPLRVPDAPDGVVGGLDYSYYEADPIDDLGDLQQSAIVRNGTADDFDISLRDRDDNFGVRYTGYVEVPENGEYTFYTDSDDGSRLYIGDELVVDNSGLHAATEESGTIQLQDGRHAITVTYFEHGGGEVLDVRWNGPGISGEQTIPESRLYRVPGPTASFTDDCDALDCSFDASGSDGGDSTISSYEWDWDGDGTYEETTTSATTDHSYSSGGTYEVTLRVTDDEGRTTTAARDVTAVEPRPADDPADTTSGLDYTYYEDDPIDDLGDLQSSAVQRTGTTDQFDLDPDHREENFGFEYTGYIEVPETGNYTFYTTSDDGSELSIGDELVVDNGGLHAGQTRSGEIALEAGRHEITVRFFEHKNDHTLIAEYEGPGVPRQEIPAGNLSRDS
jgi:PKD repeat protein